MRAREALLTSDLIPGDLGASSRSAPRRPATPRVSTRSSELLYLGGRATAARGADDDSEAWENNTEMDPAQRAFYSTTPR